jgi:hypothetical protein
MAKRSGKSRTKWKLAYKKMTLYSYPTQSFANFFPAKNNSAAAIR